MAWALTSGLPRSVHSHLDGSVVGGHLGGVGEHGDGQGETLPWGERGKGRRLVPGATHNTLVSPRSPLTFQKGQALSSEPGQKTGLWVKFQLLGLAFKAPGGLAPTLPSLHLPALLRLPWLIPLCFLSCLCFFYAETPVIWG